jgi:hypothetical protein
MEEKTPIHIYIYLSRCIYAEGAIRAGCAQSCIVLLGTHHIFHHIASEVAKFISLNFL